MNPFVLTKNSRSVILIGALLLLATLISSCKKNKTDENYSISEIKIPGLTTNRDQASYMIGLDLGKSLESVRDDVDPDMIIQGLEDALSGETPLIDEKQSQQIREVFAQYIQEKRIETLTAASKNK